MSQPAYHSLLDRLPRTLSGAIALLTLVVWGSAIPAGYVARSRFGADGLLSAVTAAAVCWIGSLIALVLTRQAQHSANPVAGVLGAMLFRTGFPLISAFVLSANSPTLAASGVFGLILVLYLPTLAAETVLSVRLVKPGRKEPRAT